ncbi:MAG TPA: ATP-binding protein [Longimicrobiales bacterium]|nr:ATP-binding protein [Longimicrobiales bacterium]
MSSTNGASGSLVTVQELASLLERDEGQFLEFKSLWDLSGGARRTLSRKKARDLVAEYVAAFANADGGTLLLGVEDDGTPSGHGYPPEAVDGILAVSESRLRPAVRCAHQALVLGGHEILVIHVAMALEAVMVDGNGFPYRVGDRVLREPQEVINARKDAYRRVGYERRIRPEASLEDLDLDLVASFLGRATFRGRSPEDLLFRFGLILPRSGGFALTNAALLLFGRSPAMRWHPRTGIRYFRVDGKERQHGTHRNVTQLGRIEAPLASAISEAHRHAKEQIRRSERLHDLFFREMPEYPEFAWQEAIVNAFAHRDYEDQAREIEVWFFDDRMEVRSPGSLVPPVTLDLLGSRRPVHASRNPLMVRVLVEAGLMREEGEGVPRMFEEMEDSLLKPPEFALGASELVVTLRNEPVFEGPSTEWQRMVQRLHLSVAQRRALLAHPGGFSNADYQTLNGVDRDRAYQDIQEMVRLGVVLPARGRGRGAVYRVAEELDEARSFIQARVPAVRAFLRRRTALKNADYRALFGVTRDAATRELKRLVQQGYLRMEGTRRGSRYLPGPTLVPGEE